LLAFHGKIGTGTSRSKKLLIKLGAIRLQTINYPISYTCRTADTKFGSIGVKC
jgi:ribosomal protein S3